MYLQVKMWLLLYQHWKTHTKRILKLKKGSEWFQHEENQTVCMSSDLFLSLMNVSHEKPYANTAGQRWAATFCTIIYIKYDWFTRHCCTLYSSALTISLFSKLSFVFCSYGQRKKWSERNKVQGNDSDKFTVVLSQLDNDGKVMVA